MARERPDPHDWVTLRDGWVRWLAAAPPPAELAALEGWNPARRPLVVARARAGDPPDALRLGLALPGRRRVGLLVHRAAVAARWPPPALEAVVGAAPAAWRPGLAGLASELRAAGVPAAVHGSLAWQHAAADEALAYVTPASDVDLLLRPPGWAALQDALAVLARWAGPPPLDGEVLLPGGAAVAWRELAAFPERLLVRTASEAALLPLAAVRDALERGAA